ncbi:MAG: carboxypeptidase regulatory-like domain-containing protein [Planctomycetes bacterium]|nr:carboxypeptidase regulatory-like domain-containing protein [Planctomycetota bacterium]
MQRSNLFLLAAVAAGIAVMTVWRLTAEEFPPPLPGPEPVEGIDTNHIGSETPPPSPPPFAGPRVVVAVQPRERFVAPPTPRVQAVQLPNREPLPTRLLAGTGSSPWDEDARAGTALVAVATDGGELVRQVAVEAGETTELELRGLLAVTGRVRDVAGSPIAGARVWLGALDTDGRNVHLETDADGAFEAGVRSGGGVPLLAWAPGYAATGRTVQVEVDDRREFEITLEPGATLAVQIAGSATEPEIGEVLVAPTANRTAAVLRYPFFLQGLVGGAALDERGHAELTFLPAEGELALTVLHPLVAIGAHREARLGKRDPCTVPLRFAPAWSGVLHDDSGVPIAGAEVLLRPEGRAVHTGGGLLLLPPPLAATGCYFAATAAGGGFTCALPRAGDVLALRARGHGGRDLKIGSEPPSAEELWLPVWHGGEPVLRLAPPTPGAGWRAEFDLGGGTVIECEPGAIAVAALPYFGAFDVTVTTFAGDEQRGERRYERVVATGPIDLQPPPLE